MTRLTFSRPLTRCHAETAPFAREGSQQVPACQLSAPHCTLGVSALSFVFVCSILLLSSCGAKSPAASPNDLFRAPLPSNWTRTGDDIRTFPPAKLYEYIDGDAEKYLRAQVQSTSTTDYKFQNKFETVVDVYTFTDSTGAKAIFDSEPSANAATPALGDAARLYEQSLIYRKGRYVVRIVAYQATPQLQQGMLDLGKSIEPNLTK